MSRSTEGASLERAIRLGDFTGEVIVDPETPLENLFNVPLMLGVLMLAISGVYLVLLTFEVVKGGQERAWSVLFAGLVLTPVGVFVRSLVDVHYRLELDHQTILRYRRIVNWLTVRKVCDFSDVANLCIDNVSSRVKDTRYSDETYVDRYSYGLLMVLKNGSKVRILDCRYQNYDLVRQRARFLAQHLGVSVRGSEGSPNLGRSSSSKGGCTTTCGVLLAVMVVGIVNTQFIQPRSRDPVKKSASNAQAPRKKRPGPSQALYAHQVNQAGLDSMALLFKSGLIQIETTEAMWKTICNQSLVPGRKGAVPNLFTVLSQSPHAVMAMAHKMELPVDRWPDARGQEVWKEKISLRVVMDFQPDERTQQVLARNLEIGLERLALGSPRGGKAILTLLVLREADKPFVKPEEHGFTLVIPAEHPINPADLGLTKS